MSRHNLRTALFLVPVFVMVLAPCVAAERAIVPLRIQNGFPIWDTGAPFSMIRKGRAEASGLKTENSFLNSARFELAGVNFGPLQLRVFDYVEPAGTDGFIGYTFFERNVVCIDFPRNRLFIARWQAGTAADVQVVDYH